MNSTQFKISLITSLSSKVLQKIIQTISLDQENNLLFTAIFKK